VLLRCHADLAAGISSCSACDNCPFKLRVPACSCAQYARIPQVDPRSLIRPFAWKRIELVFRRLTSFGRQSDSGGSAVGGFWGTLLGQCAATGLSGLDILCGFAWRSRWDDAEPHQQTASARRSKCNSHPNQIEEESNGASVKFVMHLPCAFCLVG
jgi:hypothetical protein